MMTWRSVPLDVFIASCEIVAICSGAFPAGDTLMPQRLSTSIASDPVALRPCLVDANPRSRPSRRIQADHHLSERHSAAAAAITPSDLRYHVRAGQITAETNAAVLPHNRALLP